MSIKYETLDILSRYNRNTMRLLGKSDKHKPIIMELAELTLVNVIQTKLNQYNFIVKLEENFFEIPNQYVQPNESIEPGTHLYGPVYVENYLTFDTLRAPYGLSRSKIYKTKVLDSTNQLKDTMSTGQTFPNLQDSFKKNETIILMPR